MPDDSVRRRISCTTPCWQTLCDSQLTSSPTRSKSRIAGASGMTPREWQGCCSPLEVAKSSAVPEQKAEPHRPSTESSSMMCPLACPSLAERARAASLVRMRAQRQGSRTDLALWNWHSRLQPATTSPLPCYWTTSQLQGRRGHAQAIEIPTGWHREPNLEKTLTRSSPAGRPWKLACQWPSRSSHTSKT